VENQKKKQADFDLRSIIDTLTQVKKQDVPEGLEATEPEEADGESILRPAKVLMPARVVGKMQTQEGPKDEN